MKTKIGLIIVLFIAVISIPGFSLESGAKKYESYLHYLQGIIFLRNNEIAKAQYELEKTIDFDKNAAPAYKELISIYINIGNVSKAQMLAKRLKNISENQDTKMFLGGYYVYAGDTTSAITQYEEILKKSPDNIDSILMLAGIYSEINPEKSLNFWDKFISYKPDSSEAYLRKSVVQRKLKLLEDAKKSLIKAIEIKPDDLLTHVALSEIYQDEQQYALAGEELYKCTVFENENYALYIRAGEMFVLANDMERAESIFKESLKVSKDDPLVYYWLGLLYESRKDWGKAVEYMEKSISGKPDVTSFLKLSYFYTQKNDSKKAIKALERAQKFDPKSPEIQFFLGLGYLDKKQRSKSIKHLKKALELNPELVDAYYYLGTIYEQNNKIDESIKCFITLLQYDPKNAVAMNYLGYTMADRNMNLDESEELIKKALAQDPENGAYLDSLGWVYFKKGKYAEAKAEILKASEKVKDPVIFEHLGDIEEVLGNIESAIENYKKAIFFTPQSKILKKKIKKLEKKINSK
ncbi:MAG: hypothetical protein A2252_09350 [Elusimicrobia bacterium RIFOXYA2_FULL_39_19]|nr:MAG: hypothetical protein A2252_09350 [Elusimicrobia bacterium RIFOXYA2_FULL_39_19]